MKRHAMISFCALAAAAMTALVGCTKSNPTVTPENGYQYTFEVYPETKALFGSDHIVWESADQIGAFVSTSAGVCVESNLPGTVALGTPCTFNVGMTNQLSAGQLMHFYYPYSASNESNTADAIFLEIPDYQNVEDSGFDADAMPQVGLPFTVKSTQGGEVVGGVRFMNLGAIAEFRIYGSRYADETITSVSFESTDAIAGEFIYDLTTVDANDVSTLAIDDTDLSATSITTSAGEGLGVGSSKDGAARLRMVLAPGSHAGTITITTDAARYTIPLTSEISFERSMVCPLSINLDDKDRVSSVPEVLFYESFSGAVGIGGNDDKWSGQVASGTLTDDNTDLKGWSFTKGFSAYGCARFGTSSVAGVAVSPAVGKDADEAVLYFKAGSWAGDGASLSVSVSDATISPSPYVIQLESAKFVEYGISISGLKSTSRITFTGSKRLFLDEIRILSGPAVIVDPSEPSEPVVPTDPVPEPSGKACRGWFELPAQADADKDGIDDANSDLYYSWTMRADAPAIRNFSSGYSKGKAHPVWVAAPMHKSYLGSSGRNDSYRDDPEIKCAQSAKFSGYTRGHMLGSSDRTVSVPTNKQAFFYSNIGAQISSGFNTGGGAWNNLEDKVDTYVCADTLYQVIGCIFETFTAKDGTSIQAKSGTNGAGASFQVPTAWYKVLLRTKSGNSGKRVDQCSASELQAVAFILPHKSNAGHKPTTDDMYSVEYVEQLTGLEFFVNVPNAPKSSYNASDWGL